PSAALSRSAALPPSACTEVWRAPLPPTCPECGRGPAGPWTPAPGYSAQSLEFSQTPHDFPVGDVEAFSEEPCARKERVRANSPNRCPTMFSVTYTGMNFLPLWTASV